jgi:hypothetical protein
MLHQAFDTDTPLTAARIKQGIDANGGQPCIFLRYIQTLTTAEVNLIHGFGCSVSPIDEGFGSEGLSGHETGRARSQAANNALDRLSCPRSVLIWFVVTDAPHDMAPSSFPTGGAYLDGCRSVPDARPVGSYCGEDFCAWAIANGGWCVAGDDVHVHGRIGRRTRALDLVADLRCQPGRPTQLQPLVLPQLGQAWQAPARCIWTPHIMHMGASLAWA